MSQNVIVQSIDGRESLASLCHVLDFDPVVLLQNQDEFNGIEGVQTEPFAEERGVISDLGGVHVLDLQLANDHLFQLCLQIHRRSLPRLPLWALPTGQRS